MCKVDGRPATCASKSLALSMPSRSTSKKLKARRTASGKAWTGGPSRVSIRKGLWKIWKSHGDWNKSGCTFKGITAQCWGALTVGHLFPSFIEIDKDISQQKITWFFSNEGVLSILSRKRNTMSIHIPRFCPLLKPLEDGRRAKFTSKLPQEASLRFAHIAPRFLPDSTNLHATEEIS